MMLPINPINHVLFSACRDNQTSADAYIGGSYNGAFTYYFCKHLRDDMVNVTMMIQLGIIMNFTITTSLYTCLIAEIHNIMVISYSRNGILFSNHSIVLRKRERISLRNT